MNVKRVYKFLGYYQWKLASVAFILGLLLVLNWCRILTLYHEKEFSEFSYPMEGDILPYVQALRGNLSPPDVNPINSVKYRFLIQDHKKCFNATGRMEKIKLLILVKSAITNHLKRTAIRETWGEERKTKWWKIKTAFLLGVSHDSSEQKRLKSEHYYHSDLIQSNFIDSSVNNTIKIIQGLRWVMKKCSMAEYILFADDDMYISIDELLDFLRNNTFHVITNEESNIFYAGSVFESRPIRSEFNEFYVSVDEYPYFIYPPCIKSSAFVLSYDALELLYYGSKYTKLFRFDDVYFGLVAKKVNLTLTDNPSFYVEKDSAGVTVKSIAVHGYVRPSQLYKEWARRRGLGSDILKNEEYQRKVYTG